MYVYVSYNNFIAIAFVLLDTILLEEDNGSGYNAAKLG
jgi:hypothetical protein